MALAPETVDAVLGILNTTAAGANPVPAIRAACPGITASRVDALDLRGETCFQVLDAFQLFLVDTRDHCWKIVTDPADASGVVVAAKD